MIGQIGLPELLVVLAILVTSAAVIWPAALICRRIGFSPWLGVLAGLPVVNVLLLWFVALAHWPAVKSARRGA